MTFTRTRFAKALRLAAMLIVIIVILSYAAFRSLSYVRGPEISIFQPVNGSTIASTSMTVIGRALRVNSLKMNGAPIQMDESGNFRETLLVFPGQNTVSFDVTDQFKRSAHYDLRIFGAGGL